jgi:hypothetical protein
MSAKPFPILIVLEGRRTPYVLLLLAMLALLWPHLAVQGAKKEMNLTFADRLACQTAVEEVYWQARIWPESNPGFKPALSEIASDAALAAMVEETLAHSVALERYWQAPITGEMLQAELERMAAASRQPAALQELYSALDTIRR